MPAGQARPLAAREGRPGAAKPGHGPAAGRNWRAGAGETVVAQKTDIALP